MEARSLTSTSSASTTEIVTWFLLIVSFFTVAARLGSKLAMTKKVGWDDLACILSLIFNIAAGASVSVLAENGLGDEMVNSQMLEAFQKSMYAMQIFYLSSICAAKLSIIFLLRLISPDGLHGRLCFALGTIIIVWGTISLISTIFQCAPPNVWQTVNGHCYDREVFWHFVGAMNILTDLLLIAFPLFIIYGLQMPLDKKIMVLSSFGSRILDVFATAFQLAYTDAFNSGNFALNIWPWIICAQISQTISIITSSVPYLRPLLEAAGNGFMNNEEFTRQLYGTAASATANGYVKRHDHEYVVRDLTQVSGAEITQISDSNFAQDSFQGAHYGHIGVAVTAGQPLAGHGRSSTHSSRHSQSRIIRATTTVETEWQDV